ncbi:MAG: VOC family protein [Spirochaetaceae bacterium]|nr:VOC family protein [Spirochaetaceae bacterium]
MTARDTRGWHIGQAALAVDDLDAAVAFYRDTLGVPFIAQPAPTLAFFDCHGVRLMLSSGTGESGAGCTLYFEVPDIDRHYAELQHRGVAFAGPPQVIHSAADYELRMAFFRDPAGNMLALMAEQGTYVGQ